MVRRWLTQRPASGRRPTKRSSSAAPRGTAAEEGLRSTIQVDDRARVGSPRSTPPAWEERGQFDLRSAGEREPADGSGRREGSDELAQAGAATAGGREDDRARSERGREVKRRTEEQTSSSRLAANRLRSRSTTPIVPATAAPAVTPSSRTRLCTPREKPFARTRLPEGARARSTGAGARRLQTGRRARKDVPPDRISEGPRE